MTGSLLARIFSGRGHPGLPTAPSNPRFVNPKYIPAGTLVGGCYRVVDQIGSGGLAAVYKVEDGGKVFALKVATYSAADLPAEERGNLDERAKREFVAIANLRHPNVIKVHHFGRYPDSDGYPFIVMDFVDGMPLYDWQATFTPSLRTLAQLFADLGDTLAYMHAHKVAHRDLKSDNLLVAGGATDPTLKVIDFNIANPASAYTLTSAGGMLGTLSHLTPEQCDHYYQHPGERFEGGPLQDLHCVGFISYEMFAGRPPWDLPSDELGVIQTIRKVPPRPLAAAAPHVPASLCDIVMQLLRKNPAERFQSGAELRDALEGILDQLPPRPYPCSFPPRPRHSSSLSTPAPGASSSTKVDRPAARSRGPLLAAGLAIGAATAGIGGGLWWATTRAQASTTGTVPPQTAEIAVTHPAAVGAERAGPTSAAQPTPKLVLPETVLPAVLPGEARAAPIVPAPSAAPIALAPRKTTMTSTKEPGTATVRELPAASATVPGSNGVLVQSIRSKDGAAAPERTAAAERLLGAPKGMRFVGKLTVDVDAVAGQRVDVSLHRPVYYGSTAIFPSRTRLSGTVSAVAAGRVSVHFQTAVLPDGRTIPLDANAGLDELQVGAQCEVVLASAL